jgi:putative flippase GtrA
VSGCPVPSVSAFAKFGCVGIAGLFCDISIFTALESAGCPALSARVASLLFATFVTWRLNRALTFKASAPPSHEEAIRYLTVTALAQGLSYMIFASLVIFLPAINTQMAVLIGAVTAALFSFEGHRHFSFAKARA